MPKTIASSLCGCNFAKSDSLENDVARLSMAFSGKAIKEKIGGKSASIRKYSEGTHQAPLVKNGFKKLS